MRFLYSKWDEELARRLKDFSSLLELFQYLVLRFGGSVEQALRFLKELQRRGYLDPEADLEEFARMLRDQRLIRETAQGLALTRKAELGIRRSAFELIFRGLDKSHPGEHQIPRAGSGGERLPETRPYRFGDSPLEIDTQQAMARALRRGLEEISLREEDLEVFETEHVTSCATVLLIDTSHSMILYGEDRITPAKQVALALTELILTQYPKDSLDVVAFGDDARRLPISRIPYLEVGPYHTNTQAGLRMAQIILRRKKHANKQVFMITDGKPSAIEEDGQTYRNPFGLDPRITSRTLEEASRCRQAGIPITTFMLARDPYLVAFVDKLTRINKGRAYYTRLGELGHFVFVDYMTNRRKRLA